MFTPPSSLVVPGALVGEEAPGEESRVVGEAPSLVGDEAPGEESRVVGADSSLVVGEDAPLPLWYDVCTPLPPE